MSARGQHLTASNRLLWPVLAAVHKVTGSVAPLLREVGLDEAGVYSGTDARVTLDQLFGVWRGAVRICDDASLGVRVATLINPAAPVSWPSPLALFEHLGMASNNLADAAAVQGRFIRLMRDGLRVQLDFDGELVVVRMEVLPEEPPAVVEFDVAVSINIARRITMRDVPLREIWFSHSDPGKPEVYAEAFRVPVRFDAPYTAIFGFTEAYRLPLPRGNPRALARLTREAEGLLAALPNGELFEDRVCAQISAELPNGNTNAGAVAEKLGVSARTLHRRLQHEETSYQDLLDRVRQRLAMQHLAAGKAIAQVAELVGFAQASTFHRAFKGWTGETPAEYQARYRAERQGAPRITAAPNDA